MVITWQSGGTPRGGVWHIASLRGRDHQQVAQAIAEPEEDVAVAERGLRGDRGVVGKDLHSDSRERLVGAGVTQVHLESYLCRQTTPQYSHRFSHRTAQVRHNTWQGNGLVITQPYMK